MNKYVKEMSNIIDKYSQVIFITILISVLIGMILLFGFNHPFWHDESHFVSTIKFFGSHFNINTILVYDQVTGPFIYVMFAIYGKIISFDIAYLRLFNLMISFVTFITIYKFYVSILKDNRTSLLSVCVLLFNPYVLGLSFFVYTDIPTLFFIIMIAWAIKDNRTLLLFIFTISALLSRQYSVFIVVSACIYFLVNIYRGRKFETKNFLALVLGCIPLLILIILWKDIAPPNGIKRWVFPDSTFYHFSYITTYIAFITIYISPIIIIVWHKLLVKKSTILSSLLISSWYFFFPIQASKVTLSQTQLDTVGLVHRYLKIILTYPLIESIVLWFFFLVGLIILLTVIRIDFNRFKNGYLDFGHFLTLSTISFILIMPLSYQVWEKYLIIVLPFIVLRLMMIKINKY